MRLLQLIETVNLLEAAKERYKQLFGALMPIIQEVEPLLTNTVNEEIDWARRILRKEDKIIWYLRWVKVEIMWELLSRVKGTPYEKQLENEYNKFVRQMAQKTIEGLRGATNVEEIQRVASEVILSQFKRKMEHFMSLGLADIENYQFGWQHPRSIFRDLAKIETEWQQKAAQTMEIDREGVDTVIRFPDGSEWVNLNRSACDQEAAAMGHCGNAATPKEGDTVLSYRTIEKDPKRGEVWKPRLTFIYNTNTGMLGEMKGRANQKPDSKYHGVIIELLKHPLVKGISGGGYKPQNNFSIEDLSKEVAEKLVDMKPGLATIAYDFKKRGMTKELLQRMEDIVEEYEAELPDYENGKFVIDTGTNDPWEFFIEYGGVDAGWPANIMSGKEYLDVHVDYPPKDAWDELPDDIVKKVGKWILENYSEQVEEWKEDTDQNFDESDSDDVWDVIDTYDIDEIKNAMSIALQDAYQFGTEKRMYESAKDWFNNISTDIPGVSVTVPFEFDKPIKVHLEPKDMVLIVSDYMEQIEYAGNWISGLGLEPYQPPSSYDDMDYGAIKELAVERLHEEGVL